MAAYTGFWTMIGDPHSAGTGIGIVMTIIVWSLVGDQMSNSQSRYCPQLMIGNLGVGLSHQHKAIHSRSLIILSHTHLIPLKSFHPSISHNDPPWINHLWIVSPFLVAKARKRLDIPLRFGHFSSCRLHLVLDRNHATGRWGVTGRYGWTAIPGQGSGSCVCVRVCACNIYTYTWFYNIIYIHSKCVYIYICIYIYICVQRIVRLQIQPLHGHMCVYAIGCFFEFGGIELDAEPTIGVLVFVPNRGINIYPLVD